MAELYLVPDLKFLTAGQGRKCVSQLEIIDLLYELDVRNYGE